MTRRTTAGRTLVCRVGVRVLLGIAGAFVVTLVSWLVASSASAAEEPRDPLTPLLDLVDHITAPVEPVHDVVRTVTEAVLPPPRTDRIVASLTGSAPVFGQPARQRATGTTAAKQAGTPEPAEPKPAASPAVPRPPEPQPVPLRPAPSAPWPAERAVPPVPPPLPAPRTESPPVTPEPPQGATCSAPVHASETTAACPARPAPPPIPVGIARNASSTVTEFVLGGRPRVSPD